MPGTNRNTGRPLDGWDHVIQSLEVIFTTRFGERVMRQWFGSLVLHLLQRTATQSLILKFFWSIALAIDLWEPRFRLIRVVIGDLDKAGHLSFTLEGEYLPEATTGNRVTGVRKSLSVLAYQSGLVLTP
jgi:phage baseplate assembly protein W